MKFGEVEISLKDEQRKIKTPKILSNKLAEETGIHLRDGSMNKYQGYMYSLEGDIRDDREYYIKHLAPLYEKLYNLKVRLRDRKKAGVFGFQIGSKGLVKFKSERMGLPLGPKINIEIPEFIRNSGKEITSSFIRGLFDTDGDIYLEHKNGKLYPRIKISNNSKKLMEQLKNLLENQFKFNLSLWMDNRTYRLVIRGEKNFIKWMGIIGSNNPKHIKKYSQWLSSRR